MVDWTDSEENLLERIKAYREGEFDQSLQEWASMRPEISRLIADMEKILIEFGEALVKAGWK